MIKKHLQKIASLHLNVAIDCWPNGGVLRCKCGHTLSFTCEDAARFLAEGWPKHCSKQKMSISDE